MPVVWVQHTDAELEDSPEGSPPWQLIPELQAEVTPDDLHIFKTYGDAFAETPLPSELQRLGMSGTVLCGSQSEACETATLWGALHRGDDVQLVQGPHTTLDGEGGGVALPAEQIMALTDLRAQRIRLPDVISTLVQSATF
ncbi:isochorismatase family protein [Deinococcus radiophilus]|uniref:Isochorismatase family protein n=1 Tax=Deinococcus radiophilus TaxID=32062 RepID=A0A3S0KH11_9DEIO|nr:isochorismatase family protein [Deinococcus radiophilus]